MKPALWLMLLLILPLQMIAAELGEAGKRLAALPGVSNANTTPRQRQISCNIQNDNKTCVNANIYSI